MSFTLCTVNKDNIPKGIILLSGSLYVFWDNLGQMMKIDSHFTKSSNFVIFFVWFLENKSHLKTDSVSFLMTWTQVVF